MLLKRQCVVLCSLEIRNTVVFQKHSVLAVLSLVAMESSGIPFRPSAALRQGARGVRNLICSSEETEITKNMQEKYLSCISSITTP